MGGLSTMRKMSAGSTLYVTVVPTSWSVAVTAPTNVLAPASSAMLKLYEASNTGLSLTSMTVMSKSLDTDSA